MLVFAVERIDMSEPARLTVGSLLASTTVSATDTGSGPSSKLAIEDGIGFGSATSYQLSELVLLQSLIHKT